MTKADFFIAIAREAQKLVYQQKSNKACIHRCMLNIKILIGCYTRIFHYKRAYRTMTIDHPLYSLFEASKFLQECNRLFNSKKGKQLSSCARQELYNSLLTVYSEITTGNIPRNI